MKTAWLARGAVAIVVAVVALLAVAGITGSTQSGCVRCHGVVAGASETAAHGGVNCVTCHAPGSQRIAFTAAQWVEMYPAALIGREPSGPVREVPRENCLRCHQQVLEGVSSGDVSGVKIRHEVCAVDASCDGCHSTTAHGSAVRWERLPVMEDCTACHRREGAPVECDTCHAGKLKGERLETGPWQVTHGAQWRETHGMGDLDSCRTCHPADYCARCHRVEMPHSASFGRAHGEEAVADKAACQSCHKSRRFCDSCHGIAMPHPTGFLREHSKLAGTVENPSCLRCHERADCEACHSNHVHPGNARISSGISSGPAGGDGR